MEKKLDKLMINFDSRDWDSIRDTINKINMIGELQMGTTSEGEQIIFDVYRPDEDSDREGLHTTVFQNNGWQRDNYYDPEDYSIEETYHKI